MIHLTKGLIRRWLDALLHVARHAGAHLRRVCTRRVLRFLAVPRPPCWRSSWCSHFLNFNRVAVLLGVYSNLPWIIGPYYAVVTMAGATILRYKLPPGFKGQIASLFDDSAFHSAFWHNLITILKPLLLPYAVGSTSRCAGDVQPIAYPLALAFVTSRRRIHDIMQQHHNDHFRLLLAEDDRHGRGRHRIRLAVRDHDPGLERSQPVWRQCAKHPHCRCPERVSRSAPPRTAKASSPPPASRFRAAWPPPIRNCCRWAQ